MLIGHGVLRDGVLKDRVLNEGGLNDGGLPERGRVSTRVLSGARPDFVLGSFELTSSRMALVVLGSRRSVEGLAALGARVGSDVVMPLLVVIQVTFCYESLWTLAALERSLIFV